MHADAPAPSASVLMTENLLIFLAFDNRAGVNFTFADQHGLDAVRLHPYQKVRDRREPQPPERDCKLQDSMLVYAVEHEGLWSLYRPTEGRRHTGNDMAVMKKR